MTLDGNPCEVEETADGRYMVRIANIKAQDLGKSHTISIADGEETVTLSALSYVKSMAAEYTDNSTEGAWNEGHSHPASPDQWADAARAIYTYWFYADAYVS